MSSETYGPQKLPHVCPKCGRTNYWSYLDDQRCLCTQLISPEKLNEFRAAYEEDKQERKDRQGAQEQQLRKVFGPKAKIELTRKTPDKSDDYVAKIDNRLQVEQTAGQYKVTVTYAHIGDQLPALLEQLADTVRQAGKDLAEYAPPKTCRQSVLKRMCAIRQKCKKKDDESVY